MNAGAQQPCGGVPPRSVLAVFWTRLVSRSSAGSAGPPAASVCGMSTGFIFRHFSLYLGGSSSTGQSSRVFGDMTNELKRHEQLIHSPVLT